MCFNIKNAKRVYRINSKFTYKFNRSFYAIDCILEYEKRLIALKYITLCFNVQ